MRYKNRYHDGFDKDIADYNLNRTNFFVVVDLVFLDTGKGTIIGDCGPYCFAFDCKPSILPRTLCLWRVTFKK